MDLFSHMCLFQKQQQQLTTKTLSAYVFENAENNRLGITAVGAVVKA